MCPQAIIYCHNFILNISQQQKQDETSRFYAYQYGFQKDCIPFWPSQNIPLVLYSTVFRF